MNEDDIKFRADNIIELYNKNINSYIDFHNLKLSFFLKNLNKL